MEYHIVFEKDEIKVRDYSEIPNAIGKRPYNPSNLFLGVYTIGTEIGAVNQNSSDVSRARRFLGKLEKRFGQTRFICPKHLD